MIDRPRTRYARSAGAHIAYQTVGDGPIDVVMIPGFVSNVEHYWDMPVVPEIFEQFAGFSRLIIWDKRGTGLSDPVSAVPTLEERVDDLCAVMDAAGSEHAALWGVSEGGPMSLMMAASHPDRVSSLVLYGTTPRFSRADDFPHGWDTAKTEAMLHAIEESWGDGGLLSYFGPSVADDPVARRIWARYERAGASPGMARAVIEALAAIDVRSLLPSVRVPTLVLHRTGDLVATIEGARLIADRIPDSRIVEFDEVDHAPMFGDSQALVDEIEEFLTGTRSERVVDRVLATVLFTDVVGSTERAAAMGDSSWRRLIERHDDIVRDLLRRYRGREIKTMGDGFLATFDGPARAIACSVSLERAVHELGIEIRAGLHTGECERMGDDVGGMAVNIGARIAALAGPGEVLVSSTVKDLVVGSPIVFAERGVHELKGVPGSWQLFAIA
ncbi:adenylate/guanylate cyclase domain-containing protein [Aeromicrobium sp.]|uniref:adenylate/guanylate cyclase domain-containing protein n=1 Tax=Aeromicrobium sp. TaxID=1871063 RepID=UPI003C468203